MTSTPMAFPRGRRTPLMAVLAVLAVTSSALLSACNGADDEAFETPATASPSPPATVTPAPSPATDAFISYVSQVVADKDDTAQPASIDGVVVTAPEDTAPLPLAVA